MIWRLVVVEVVSAMLPHVCRPTQLQCAMVCRSGAVRSTSNRRLNQGHSDTSDSGQLNSCLLLVFQGEGHLVTTVTAQLKKTVSHLIYLGVCGCVRACTLAYVCMCVCMCVCIFCFNLGVLHHMNR